MAKNPPADAGNTSSSPDKRRPHVPWDSWAYAPRRLSLRSRARTPQSLCSAREATTARDPGATTGESPRAATKTQGGRRLVHQFGKKKTPKERHFMYKTTVKIQRCFMGNNGKQRTVKQHLLSAKSGVAGGRGAGRTFAQDLSGKYSPKIKAK